ncbi:hypothetical protein FAZ95_38865 [Trinickia violacea]|uniref:Uncharacterized protein n=1 Tax=Trinickia violacea TaxID=2571746 RepID=A0A4P8J7H5_9BURK|nr:hypothetical protein [Trinickia violacea]QCP55099.1 hypothetical protein FAZ95_38865 [Trinickia violacea]
MFSRDRGGRARVRQKTTITAESPPEIVDANGNVVGVIGLSGFDAYGHDISEGAVVRIGKVPVYLEVSPYSAPGATPSLTQQLYWHSENTYFPNTDCSGPPLIVDYGLLIGNPILTGPYGFRPSALVTTANSATLYIATTGTPTQQIAQSVLNTSAGTALTSPSCRTLGMTVQAYPLGTTVDLQQMFPAPLHIQ